MARARTSSSSSPAPSLPPPTPSESDVDAVYALPLGEFVAGRKRVADTLKRLGDAAGARALLALQKPALSAWVTNQTVRRAPGLLAQLVAATEELAAAQRDGGRSEQQQQRYQSAIAAQRHVVARLTDAARAVAAESGQAEPETLIERVEKNFRWGAISDEIRPALVRGRLVRDVPAPGFGGLVSNGGPGDTAGARQSGRANGGTGSPAPIGRRQVRRQWVAPAAAPSHDRSGDARAEARQQAQARKQAAAEARRDEQRRQSALRAELLQATTKTARAERAVEAAARDLDSAKVRLASAQAELAAAQEVVAATEATHGGAVEALAAARRASDKAAADLEDHVGRR